MKAQNTFFLCVLVTMLPLAFALRGSISAHDVGTHPASKGEGPLQGKLQLSRRRTKKRKKNAQKKSRVIVRYQTAKGKHMALDLASTVYYDFGSQKSLVVDVDKADEKKLKAFSHDILAVDTDTAMKPLFRRRIQTNIDANMLNYEQITPYGIPMVQADQVTVPKKKKQRNRVCLVDTGVLHNHPDLPKTLMRGRNRYSTTYNTELRWRKGVDGHGTCLAGILSANMTNNIGIRGVGDIPLFITRGMNNQGQAMQSDILAALSQCEASGSKIISLSFGGGGISTTFAEMLDQLYDERGILIFAASGNNGEDYAMYPAAYPKVVSVGALNASGERWSFSDWGPSLELMAPGDNVWCTGISNGQPTYSLYAGTSMAAPYAAGVAALVWSHFPSCTNAQIRYVLAHTAKDIGSPGCDQFTGNGIVQAKAAFDFLAANPCSHANWGTTSSTDTGCGVAS